MSKFRFPDAVHAVETWLDGTAAKLTRKSSDKSVEWELDLREQGYPVKSVRLRLDSLFPAVPCELFVSPELCLQLPHVEQDGRVCLGEKCQPADFDEPIEAVARLLTRFRTELLQRSANQEWCETELYAERLSYWSRFCDQRQKFPRGRPRPNRTLVSMQEVDDWAEGKIAAFIPKNGRHHRIHTQVVTLDGVDPSELASRHGFALGTIARGSAAFIRLPDNFRWSPLTWPKDFIQLDKLVRSVTADERSVVRWLQRHGWSDDTSQTENVSKKSKVAVGFKPLLVVLCHGKELYGYQISQPIVSLVAPPHAAPVKVDRVDASWAMTRDHAAAAFNLRQQKRILVLGAGSLGSPVIDVLARAGIGAIDVVDSQLFESPNVSRHLLGMSSLYQGKASAIATRLRKEIPGLQIRGFTEDARRWCCDNCTPGKYDLVVDLTADSSVRIFLAHTRKALLSNLVLVHAWVEPYCAATHVVASDLSVPWPAADPAGKCVNAADFSAAEVRVNLPACSAGFHPYGSADIVQAAGFAAERILDVIDKSLAESTVWSAVRTQAFFDSLGLPIVTKPIVPVDGGPRDGTMLTRPLKEVLRDK